MLRRAFELFVTFTPEEASDSVLSALMSVLTRLDCIQVHVITLVGR